jgi:hypothetical protein
MSSRLGALFPLGEGLAEKRLTSRWSRVGLGIVEFLARTVPPPLHP